MAFKFIVAAQYRSRESTTASGRAGATLVNGKLVDDPTKRHNPSRPKILIHRYWAIARPTSGWR
jgi:hypothetical protein